MSENLLKENSKFSHFYKTFLSKKMNAFEEINKFWSL